jgi:predicted RND superfamily exporter protein
MLNILHKFRFLLLLLTLASCWLLWPGWQKALEADNSLSVWFLENDPALEEYHKFQERFGNDEVVIVMVRDGKTLLSKSYFHSFVQAGRSLATIPEVLSVMGPGSINILSRDPFGLFSKPLLTDTSQPEEVQAALEKTPVLKEQLFSNDYKTARFVVVFKQFPDFEKRRVALLDQVKRTVHHYFPEKNTYFGGIGVIYEGLNTLSQKDFGFFLGLGYLAMFLLLLFIYRKPLLLVYILGTIALATYVTLGIYGTLGFRLNLMTLLIPCILILLGIMDAMHILNERSQIQAEALTNKENALLALKRLFRPCLFTSLTTAAGFLALMISPMAILKSFGLFSALGILLCLLFTYVLGVILLPLVAPSNKVTGLASQKLATFIRFTDQRKKLFTAVSVSALLLGAAGIAQLKADTYTLGYFPASHSVVKDHEAMEASWGPYMPLELLVEPTNGGKLYAAAVLKSAVAFADSAKKLRGVNRVFGFHSFYQAALQTQYGAKSSRMYESNAALRAVHEQIPVYYPGLSRQFIDEFSQTGRMILFGKMASANELNSKIDTLNGILRHSFGGVAKARFSGYQPMYSNIVGYVTRSQVNSLLLSVLLVFLLVWIFIKKARLALLATFTNFFPIIVMLGVMGWFAINLDTATASIAAIVLSFCIDDTIHFIYHFRKHTVEGSPTGAAIKSTITHVGPSIVLTSLVLFVGYSLMGFASLKTVKLFGLLTAVAVAAALFAQMILFPILLKRFPGQERHPAL